MAKTLTMSKWKYSEGGQIYRTIGGVNGVVTMGRIVKQIENGEGRNPTVKIEYSFEPN